MLWQCPQDAVAALVLAHGAGADMTHASMQAIAAAFEQQGIATLRFNFPYMEAGRNRVDSPAVACDSIAAAFAAARERTTLPIWIGGHSFGGRMASHAIVDRALPAAGLILCSFPLHMPGKPDTKRAQHLAAIAKPMLFLSGTRDDLADAKLLEPLVASLPTAKLHWLATADHGYKVLKRTRTRTDTVFEEMAETARAFIDEHGAPRK
jgi:predicted alpha/beta-hydrolase family hydrolase